MAFRKLSALSLVFLFVPSLSAQEIRARGEITVSRLIVDAHVSDYDGTPIEGLGPEDFRVRVNGQPAEVEAVEWIAYYRPSETVQADPDRPDLPQLQPPGRLIVMFFQTDFARVRLRGQMRITAHALEMLERLGPNDRIAVVSHDSHLKVRQDFTGDREKLRTAIVDSMKIDFPQFPDAEPAPSLVANIDPVEAKQAARPETALYVVGKALQEVDGPKTLLLFGWGLGHYTAFGVVTDRDYPKARYALEQARTSVFTLDISEADYHSLEVGLQKASADTGGTYERTHVLTRGAMQRTERTISARYELTIKAEDLEPGMHIVEIDLPGRRGNVWARRLHEIKE